MNDHFIKINKCIESSNTMIHFNCCEKLICNFQKMFYTKKRKEAEKVKKLVQSMVENLNRTKSEVLGYL